MSVWQIAFGFQGRIRRSVYWAASIAATFAFWLPLTVVIIAMGMGFETLGKATAGDGATNAIAWLAIIVGLALTVAYLWAAAAIGVKRCHDRNYSGWMLLAMYVVAFLPFGFIWSFVDLGCLDGTPGPNPYGPSPKGIGGPEQAFA